MFHKSRKMCKDFQHNLMKNEIFWKNVKSLYFCLYTVYKEFLTKNGLWTWSKPFFSKFSKYWKIIKIWSWHTRNKFISFLNPRGNHFEPFAVTFLQGKISSFFADIQQPIKQFLTKIGQNDKILPRRKVTANGSKMISSRIQEVYELVSGMPRTDFDYLPIFWKFWTKRFWPCKDGSS